MTQAHSLLSIKAINDDERTFTGTATTPTPDSGNDVIDPLGVTFSNPLPLLFHHDQQRPVGIATLHPPTAAGIDFTASIPHIADPGTLKDRVDEAWHSVKAGLIRAVSVRVAAKRDHVEPRKGGGLHWRKSEIHELSLVTIPANREATIRTVKELDQAASGPHLPGVTGLPVVRACEAPTAMKTITEQITDFQNTRAAKVAAMTALMTTAAEKGETLDDAQTQTYDGLVAELKAIDAHLPRLQALDAVNVASAKAVPTAPHMPYTPAPVVHVKPNVVKGTAFTRYCMAMVVGKNSRSDAIRYVEENKQWMDQTPEVLLALKAAVNPGTILEPAWAAPLAVARPMVEEFLELLRPETLIGKVPGLRNVPFNVSMPVQTGGGTYNWVGEAAPKPVGQLQLGTVTLGIAKAAGIIIISEELAKISSPSAEGVIRNDMIKGMAQYLDQQFITPSVAAVTNVSPASITNLANGFATAGTSGDNARTDIKKAITLMTGTSSGGDNYPISELVLIMSESNAFALSTALTSNGVLVNAGLSMKGGTMLGLPVVTSQTAGSTVALVHTPSILFADDGGVNIDVSREASVELNTVPTSPLTTSTVLISLWQQNLIGLRAERFINWKRARTTAVVYTTATYV